MSIDTKQIIHIASEVVIMGSITAFFLNKTNILLKFEYYLNSNIFNFLNLFQNYYF